MVVIQVANHVEDVQEDVTLIVVVDVLDVIHVEEDALVVEDALVLV